MAHYRRERKRVAREKKVQLWIRNRIVNRSEIIRVVDQSEYEAGMCNNGGRYEFWVDYVRTPLGWELHHDTSAEFQYCEACGNFGGHWETAEDGEEYRTCPWERISSGDLVHLLRAVDKNPDTCRYYHGDKAHFWFVLKP